MKREDVNESNVEFQQSGETNNERYDIHCQIAEQETRVGKARPNLEKSRKLQTGFAKGTFGHVAEDFDAPLADFEVCSG